MEKNIALGNLGFFIYIDAMDISIINAIIDTCRYICISVYLCAYHISKIFAGG
jgi:hypothetical protein